MPGKVDLDAIRKRSEGYPHIHSRGDVRALLGLLAEVQAERDDWEGICRKALREREAAEAERDSVAAFGQRLEAELLSCIAERDNLRLQLDEVTIQAANHMRLLMAMGALAEGMGDDGQHG